MRTYAPATTTAVLDAAARGAVARPRRRPPRGPRRATGGLRRRGRTGSTRGSVAASRSAASSGRTPTRRTRSRPCTPGRTSSSSRRRRPASRCATRCRSSRPSPRTRRPGPCSCSRPRRSARTRWRSSGSSCRTQVSRSSSACYDGDTPAPIRSAIRKAGQVVVTNPDMLHSAILPHHTKWFQLFEQLRVIVIDELHTYRGVFGSHVANVLRRLLRLCAHYGVEPGHRVLLGHDREPGGARGDAHRPPGPAHRPQRRAVGREAPPARRSAGHRRGDRAPAARR